MLQDRLLVPNHSDTLQKMKKNNLTKHCFLVFRMLTLFLIMTIVASCKNSKNKAEKEKRAVTLNQFDSLHRNNSKYLRKEDLSSYLKKAMHVKPNPKAGKPFDTLNYDKVIAYDFDGSEEPYPSVIDKNGSYVPVILRQQYLTQRQTDEIVTFLTDKRTYGETTSACFNPHLELLFLKNEKIIYSISVCLDCNYLLSTSEIPAMNHKKINAGTENEYYAIGFTKNGQLKIKNFCKELNFHYGELKND